MKKLNRLLIVIVWLNLVQFCFVGCPSCPSCIAYYEFVNLKVLNYDNSGLLPVESETDIPSKAYAIGLILNVLEVREEVTTFLNNSSCTLKATSCECGENYFEDSLIFINIYDLINFNEDFPAKSLLNELFFAQYGFDSLNKNLLTPYVYDREQKYFYYLFATPSKVDTHRFVVEMHLKSGKILADTTLPVVLTL